jgi:hypothetical protein
LEQNSLHEKRERERAQARDETNYVLSTFFHKPNVVLPKRIKVPKARRSGIQVIEMKRWPPTYSYRQTTLDRFESRSMCCPNSFGMKVVNFKGKTPHTVCAISLFHVEIMKRFQCQGCWDPLFMHDVKLLKPLDNTICSIPPYLHHVVWNKAIYFPQKIDE